jgi:carbonic anhydrase/acetyltransferase-like protein (isoleucine patch superfamily)
VILSSGTKKPKIHASSYVAPTATISGEVTIGAECAVLHGAVVTAEGAPVTIGDRSVVMENAVLKASGGAALQYPLSIGERCIVGPHAYVVGATIGNGAFVASGAKIFNGAVVEDGASVGAGAVVGAGALVQSRPGHAAEHISTIFNLERGADEGARAAAAYAKFLLKAHAQDAALEDHRNLKPAPRRRSSEEPPPTQATQVDKVVDVMMLELEEMEHRRQQAIKRQKGG